MRSFFVAALIVLLPGVALAAPKHPTTARLEPPKAKPVLARSIGSPTNGRLVAGVHLPDAPYLRVVPVYQPGDARWGVDALVGAIDRAARSVKKQFPDSVLSVGHFSHAAGGDIDRHASHESGRDADIGFFVTNDKKKPIYADHFVSFLSDGTAPTWPGARFDDARNWAFIASLVGDPRAHVSHIFVASPLRTRLLQYAERIGAPPNLRKSAAELMAQPRGSLPHDDHFHVRVSCPIMPGGGVDKCIEQPLPHRHLHAPEVAHAQPTPPHTTHHGAPPARRPPSPPPADESSVPSLAPEVPGLGAALIPAPLMKTEPLEREAPAAPALPPVDDPDGVLEH